MNAAQAAALGVIQGLTEFLPISSSAHLILASRFFGWPDQGLDFDMAAHVGSLVALVIYFRGDLARLVTAGRRRRDGAAQRLLVCILLATLPVAVAGLLLQGVIETWARAPLPIAVATIFFALVLAWADRRRGGSRGLETISRRSAVGIGFSQALALVPGTSRSGVTISAGILLGLDRETAARFSFLIALPVGVLVAGHELGVLAGGGAAGHALPTLAIGFVTSALSAYLAIHWLLKWLRSQGLMIFVVYRLLLGAVLLITHF